MVLIKRKKKKESRDDNWWGAVWVNPITLETTGEKGGDTQIKKKNRREEEICVVICKSIFKDTFYQ